MVKAKGRSKTKTSKAKISNKFKTKKSKGNLRRNAASQRGKESPGDGKKASEPRQTESKLPQLQQKKDKVKRKQELLTSISFQNAYNGHSVGNLLDSEDEDDGRMSLVSTRNAPNPDEALYEQTPRQSVADPEQDTGNNQLLPVKGRHGIIKRHVARDEPGIEPEMPDAAEDETEDTVMAEPVSLSVIDLYAARQKNIHDRTLEIAKTAQTVIQDPSQKIDEVDGILKIAKSTRESVLVRKRALLSLLEIFKDIIPGYRIRPLTEAEQNTKISKEVKYLRSFETSLLTHYKSYLEILEDITSVTVGLSRKKQGVPEGTLNANVKLGIVAVRCFSELLLTKTHFNYRVNIVTALVPRMNLTNEYAEMGDLCVATFKSLFKDDDSGQVSLEAVQVISRMTKTKLEYTRSQVIETFLKLRINPDILKHMREKETKAERLKRISHERKMLSRKDRKRKKASVKLEQELKEVEMSDDMGAKKRVQTEILKLVFAMYFRVLKMTTRTPMLSPTLRGLSKFAQLINVDFFNDLFARLKALIASQELKLDESLNCIHTAFTILSGQGEAFNLDPHEFYVHLYNILLEFSSESSDENVELCVKCLELMLVKRRKQISPARVLAFMKRIATVSAVLRPEHAVVFLSMLKTISLGNVKTQPLFDDETAGRGVFRPELPDPEHCNADCTKLWELCVMARHFSTAVRQTAQSLAAVKSNAPATLFIDPSRTPSEPTTDAADLSYYFPSGMDRAVQTVASNPRERGWLSLELSHKADDVTGMPSTRFQFGSNAT